MIALFVARGLVGCGPSAAPPLSDPLAGAALVRVEMDALDPVDATMALVVTRDLVTLTVTDDGQLWDWWLLGVVTSHPGYDRRGTHQLQGVEGLQHLANRGKPGSRIAIAVAPDVPFALVSAVQDATQHNLFMFGDHVVEGPGGVGVLPFAGWKYPHADDIPAVPFTYRFVPVVHLARDGVRLEAHHDARLWSHSDPDHVAYELARRPPWAGVYVVDRPGDCLVGGRLPDGRVDTRRLAPLLERMRIHGDAESVLLAVAADVAWSDAVDVYAALARVGPVESVGSALFLPPASCDGAFVP